MAALVRGCGCGVAGFAVDPTVVEVEKHFDGRRDGGRDQVPGEVNLSIDKRPACKVRPNRRNWIRDVVDWSTGRYIKYQPQVNGTVTRFDRLRPGTWGGGVWVVRPRN